MPNSAPSHSRRCRRIVSSNYLVRVVDWRARARWRRVLGATIRRSPATTSRDRRGPPAADRARSITSGRIRSGPPRAVRIRQKTSRGRRPVKTGHVHEPCPRSRSGQRSTTASFSPAWNVVVARSNSAPCFGSILGDLFEQPEVRELHAGRASLETVHGSSLTTMIEPRISVEAPRHPRRANLIKNSRACSAESRTPSARASAMPGGLVQASRLCQLGAAAGHQLGAGEVVLSDHLKHLDN